MSDAPIVYTEDRDDGKTITYYRASSLGLCPNAFVFARKGHTPRVPPNMQKTFDTSAALEQDVIGMLDERGYLTFNYQHEVIIPLMDLRVIGHIDCLVKNKEKETRLAEIKCLNAENTEKFLDNPASFPNYMWQVAAYSHALGYIDQQILFAVYNKDDKQLHEMWIDVPFTYAELATHVAALETYWEVYKEADQMQACPPGTKWCPYFYLHDEIPDDYPTIENDFLVAMLRSHSTIKGRMKTLTETLTRIDDRIKNYTETQGWSKGRGGRLQIPRSKDHPKAP